MRWPDERYVKLYTRDEADWAAHTWQAKGIFYELNRKCDRAGIIKLGKMGLRALAGLLRAQWPEIEPFVQELLEDGCIQDLGVELIVTNHVEAQEAHASPAARKTAERERDRDVALSASRDVTRRHAESREVTIQKSLSQPIPAHPKLAALTPPNPRHAPVRARLESAFREERGAAMGWDGGEGKALTVLLARADDAEIERRWRTALKIHPFPGCNSVRELAQAGRWNALAGRVTSGPAPPGRNVMALPSKHADTDPIPF